MSEDDGLINAYQLDGRGGGKRFTSWNDLPADTSAGNLWIHLDRSVPAAQRWLINRGNVHRLAWNALLAEDTRPRCLTVGDGILLNLRGVNLNPDAVPEDMVAIRLWLEKDRVLTSRTRQVMAIDDLCEELDIGAGPRDTATFIAMVAERLTARMDPVVDALQDKLDVLEDQMINAPSLDLRAKLAELRRETIMLRRYISPQRDALRNFVTQDVSWLDQNCQNHLLETADHVSRYLEDLDSISDRATVINDELSNRLTERMDKTVYRLTLVTIIFLPLDTISALLGTNVGGIPGENYAWGFIVMCMAFTAIAAAEVWLFKRLRWWRI